MIQAFLLTATFVLGSGPGSDQQTRGFERSPTYGKPAETFVSGCDLILRGKDVPKVTENGQLGYKIVKRSDAVLVNGIVYVEGLPEALEPAYIDPEILKEAAVRDAAIEFLYRKMERRENTVAVEGATYQLGVPFKLTVPETGHEVEVTISEDASRVRIKYGADGVSYPIQRPVPISDDVRLERRVDVAYRVLIGDLRPGFLVIKGSGGTTNSFPLAQAEEVRSSLSRIRGQAKIERVDSLYGRVYYEVIRDGNFVWYSDIVQDFAVRED